MTWMPENQPPITSPTDKRLLLTRDQFRSCVLARREFICCVPWCTKKAVDAHHIIERGLWTEQDQFGGYFLSNGAAVCEEHHRLAESNHITPDALRRWCEIKSVALPRHLEGNLVDKWGTILKSGKEAYPSTPYLPCSPETDHGQTLENIDDFLNVGLIVTAKMDGANMKMTREIVTGRNGEHANNPIFDQLKADHAAIKGMLPEGVEIFAEWMKFCHSIHYTGNLRVPSRILVFGARCGSEWLSWQDTIILAEENGLSLVPSLGRIGPFEQEWQLLAAVSTIAEEAIAAGHEGVVVRSEHSFYDAQFTSRVAKYVRSGFRPGLNISKLIKNEVGK